MYKGLMGHQYLLFHQHVLILFFIFQDFGEIQFIRNEFLVEPNSFEIEIVLERIHSIRDKVEVKWKLSNDVLSHTQQGTVFFSHETDEKVIKLNLQNAIRNSSYTIVLFEPSNGYQLGKNNAANISFACKFLWE